MKEKDIAGQRFGYLVALEKLPSNGKAAIWHCICDCGVTTSARGTALRFGSVKSCGCLRSHNFSKVRIDITNVRFGDLVALERHSRTASGKIIWRCACDCGRETKVCAQDLKRGNTKSCGCKKNRRKPTRNDNDAGIYAICFASGHVKFGKSTRIRMRISQYKREIAIAGGANVYLAECSETAQTERNILDEAKGLYPHVCGELFLCGDDEEIVRMIIKHTGANTIGYLEFKP